ncbi:CsbD family protein [Edaphobacter flagellatus]|uniref:CsbD family protein n=1 Tax=Edaphobacter flagellatus TaxID=1933044 RepID=UPI0021B1BBA6|nr:CsbD family protein [Edaphobacter flagellatus]
MNKETLEGKFDQVAGAVKQKVGETVGNQKLASSGVADQVKGAAKETWGKAKDAATSSDTEAKVHDMKQHAEEKLDEAREKVVDTAQNIKNKINEKIDSFRDQHTNRG